MNKKEMKQLKVDNVIGEQYVILKGVDLLDIDLNRLTRKLDAYPVWDIYKLYSYYSQIIKADLYDINKDVENARELKKELKELKELKKELLSRLKYFDDKAKYIEKNIYIEDKAKIKYKVLT